MITWIEWVGLGFVLNAAALVMVCCWGGLVRGAWIILRMPFGPNMRWIQHAEVRYKKTLLEFARLRVKHLDLSRTNLALHEALSKLHAAQNGPPLERDREEWDAAMRLAEEALEVRG